MESMGFVGRLRWLAAVLAGAAAMALSHGHVAAQSPQEVQHLADQTIRRLDLQTSFPVVPELIIPRFSLPSEVLWIVIGIALVIMLYAFRDLIPILRSAQGNDWISEEAFGGGGKAGSPAVALGAADELAAQGRFVEAMHVLLLQGLVAIRAGLDEEFADSLTSREILRRARLPDPGRTSLRDIVNRVELTYFGQYPAALADYEACRASFNTLTQALHGSAPA
jgi:uncharacterized protein DUF4129